MSSFEGGVRGVGTTSVVRGWLTLGSRMRAVYRVDFIAEDPAGDWRVFVDGETAVELPIHLLDAVAQAVGQLLNGG